MKGLLILGLIALLGITNSVDGQTQFNWTATDGTVVKFSSSPEEMKFDATASIELPFEAAAGSTICLVDNLRVHIPIEVSDHGPNMFGVTFNARVMPEM